MQPQDLAVVEHLEPSGFFILQMRFDSTDELARELIQMRLITAEQLTECQSQHPVTSEPRTLLRALEHAHLLTAYQLEKLRSGEDAPLVLGNCKLMYQNASGSFARVFRGCHLDDGRVLGLKVLRQRFVADPKAVRHFHREAELCMNLRHKNIVPTYDVGSEDDYHYFTMEFVEGGNLRDFIRIRNKLKPAELLRCGADMAEGLEYALGEGMTHRDFKMSNVLMSTRGVAKLVDFGLAGDESASTDESVQAVEYATLERNTNAPRNDPRSDLFFLGAVLYELACGVSPWPGTRRREERKQFSRYTGIRPLRQVDPGVDPAIAEIIDHLLKINPNERYQSASELLSDLKTALSERGESLDRAEEDDEHRMPRLSTVMCVENRIKQQDLLRDYLSKHGFRVLMLSAWDRALARLKSNPPDCLLLIDEALDGDATDAFDEAARWSELQGVACVMVLNAGSEQIQSHFDQRKTVRALLQPVTLRDVRNAIVECLQSNLNRE